MKKYIELNWRVYWRFNVKINEIFQEQNEIDIKFELDAV